MIRALDNIEDIMRNRSEFPLRPSLALATFLAVAVSLFALFVRTFVAQAFQIPTGSMEENLLIGQSLNNTSMLNLVGKKVTVQGDSTWCEEGSATESIVISEGPGRCANRVSPGWKARGMKVTNPPVSSCRSRTCARCSARSASVSMLPIIMVAVVCIPRPWAASITAIHCAEEILCGLISLRTLSDRISAPPPGMLSRPAARRY